MGRTVADIERPKREHQVLLLAAEGMTDKEIARELGISAETVATYWRRILLRTGAASRTEVVAREFQRKADVALEEEQSRNRQLVSEIAERKVMEQQLRSAVNRLRLLMEHVPVGVIFENNERCILFVNERLCDVFKLSEPPSKFVGMNCKETAEGNKQLFADGDGFVRRVEEVVAAAVPVHHEQFELADGRWVERDYQPVMSDNHLIGHLWLFRDITHTKRVKNELRYRNGLAELVASVAPKLIAGQPAEVNGIIIQTLEEVGRYADSDRATVFRLSEDGLRFEHTHEWCREGIASRQAKVRDVPVSMCPWWMTQLRQGNVITAASLDDLPREAASEKQVLAAQGILSVMDVPMLYNGQLVGFVGFDAVRSERPWGHETEIILRALGDMFGSALESKCGALKSKDPSKSNGKLV